MVWYILRRVLQVIPVFLGATLLIYFMVFALPGDPIAALGGDRGLNPAVADAIRSRYHLDEPFIVQYFYYLQGIFTGNLGTTFSGQPVSEILARTLPVTFRLAIIAIVIEAVAGILIGLIAGLRKNGAFDTVSLLFSLVLISMPIFVLAFLAQFVFAIQLGWARTTVSGEAPFSELILPAFVLAFFVVANVIRLTRTSVIENLDADFVRTATAKGLSRPRIIRVHVLRNSLIPVVTLIGTDFGLLIVGATVTEGIFNVPGVGNTLFKAILLSEAPTVVSFVTVFVIVYLISNLLVDILYAFLDPRIRYGK
ncbi:peptide ABC transporter [Salinibacterium xinjiangense]|uniref:Oligopeptide transport system permease protein n=1 Tax=Salinibacterium xinjiangense TaxID=386302 RepID=A0A2C8ZHS7_9MICO|nr:ABC transporter permease [Salinibacterium xinjiangense]GGK89483.1 peptide ABC transporter [Salinibacterium xinjiangense]SOE64213.1 oligopeptide transport system permease protein [Salinibacterium xinjiangense]